MTERLLYALLSIDHALQWGGILLSLLGLSISIWLASQAWYDYTLVRDDDVVERIVARAHLRSQFVILFLQVIFLKISAMALTLPHIPSGMASPYTDWVLFVLLTRKLGRAMMITLLAWAAWRQALDRRKALLWLAAANGRS